MKPEKQTKTFRRFTNPVYLLASSFLALLLLIPWHLFLLLDDAVLPLFFWASSQKTPPVLSQKTTLVAIDDLSIEKHDERWPWSRRTMAQIMDRFTAAQTQAVGVDLYFASPNPDDRDGDQLLASAIARNGGVVLATSASGGGENSVQVSPPMKAVADTAFSLGVPIVYLDPLGSATRAGLHVDHIDPQQARNALPIEILLSTFRNQQAWARIDRDKGTLELIRQVGNLAYQL